MKISDFYKIDVSRETLFEKYTKILLEWNNKINLTAITEINDIILKHYVDSLSIAKYINNNSKVLDIGTGAGFPGIPLKIYNNTLKIDLLDSLNKRIVFLNEVINKLDLKEIKAIHSRAEDLAHNNEFREKYDVVTTRAVANLNTLVEYMLPFCKVGGICICMKGPNVSHETSKAKSAILMLGGKIEKVDNFMLYNTDIERNVVIIRKIEETSKKYPRKAGTPLKEPLK